MAAGLRARACVSAVSGVDEEANCVGVGRWGAVRRGEDGEGDRDES